MAARTKKKKKKTTRRYQGGTGFGPDLQAFIAVAFHAAERGDMNPLAAWLSDPQARQYAAKKMQERNERDTKRRRKKAK